MEETIRGLKVERLHHYQSWQVVHADSGLPLVSHLRQRRFAEEAREDFLRTGVDFELSANELSKSGTLARSNEVRRKWEARARSDYIDPETFEFYSDHVHYGAFVPSAALASRMRQFLNVAVAELAAQDAVGAPYGVTHRVPVDWYQALAIARSPHPARVLAIKGVYRYGTFEEQRNGEVTVTMMGNLIATFGREHVHLDTAGTVSLSTTEALSTLAGSAGGVYTHKGTVYFDRYARHGHPVEFGTYGVTVRYPEPTEQATA